MNERTLNKRIIFITGASRGIGRAIALKCASEGANIVIAAKSDEPHPTLSGTIHSVAKEVEDAGGQALALKVDVRDEAQVQAAMKQAADHFGGIDVLVNNAGAISLTPVETTPVKKYDLMNQINSRAVFVCSQAALPYLKKSEGGGHILNLSPPLNLNEKWLKPYAAYTLSKYGMTILTLGMASEFKRYNIAVNSLWPRTTIATAALASVGGKSLNAKSRKPEIMADAAREIFVTPDRLLTGQVLLDEDLLRERGMTNFVPYACDPENADNLFPDLFLD
ncbi:SDR family oxidoreductase [Sansalvadorimonas verongulae]|uniref:SDR family oxidoreductase n=1 Tax=Sansalvadorimonas verongulae TaxID=2172824 RepID=UPI0012BD5696|nr:NAD(P)-dependent oxidoreductase [Sansalvadorimonas verongulae]MTI15439.1 NAD(P)-dependent oxidoreductase [Sansalvadorimonas verongulae]